MNVTFTPTAHGTVHAFGTASAVQADKLLRSIASRAGRKGLGSKLRRTVEFDNDTVTIHVAYVQGV